jgi:hypothetical protein
MAFRLAAAMLLCLALTGSAQGAARPVAGAPPTGLKGFLLRADESPRRVFNRTPSFAWKPVPGAVRYDFQLSTSSVFRENGIVFSESSLTSPAASVPLTLPWITGSPYSLYARVRAVLAKTITPWSRPFGFNLRWNAVPKPLPSYPGLLRWTPVEGAAGYQVWFVDLPKIVSVYSNVVDEREFYTFHQGNQWIGNVRWRVRAHRWVQNKTVNGLPTVSYGPWSPVYSSVNPPFSLGSLTTTATISDVVARGRSIDPAHRLMPAFVFGGNQGLAGVGTELYRVYVFTDRDCVNPVFKGAVVGSPAYAPRPFGPLSLPRTVPALVAARGTYLPDGDEGSAWTADFRGVKTTESEPEAKPTTSLQAGEGSSSSSSTKPPGNLPSAPPAITIEEGTKLGAPVDLWDTDWPRGGYYWTVVPVAAVQPAALTTSLAAVAATGATQVSVASSVGFAVGDQVQIGPAPGEQRVIVAMSGTTVTLSTALAQAHGPGEAVVRLSGSLEYRELELPQEICASGRVMRFGKTSEPALTKSSAPFASGLSTTGRLISASTKAPRFYGTPHVAWTPALGAALYEVQWSKTRYPFRAETDPRTGTKGLLTLSTSALLPLKPGTWWYRVRGINYSLPTGAQQMSWSAAARVGVAKPRFTVVRGRRP